MNQSKKSHGQFFWGVTAGVIAALVFVIGNDLSWKFWDGPTTAGASIQTGDMDNTRELWISDLPAGIRVEADGREVASELGQNVSIRIPESAQRLDLRNANGIVWTTSLRQDYGDTLYPVLGGEIVVEVHAQGPRGELRLDGAVVGQAPGVIEDVAPGWHWVSIHRDGKEVFQEVCYVRTGEAAGIIAPPAPPHGKGRVTIMSRAMSHGGFKPTPGATVFVDGDPMGQTPLELILSAGFHSVRVEQDGYGHLVDVFHLGAGLTRHVQADFGLEDVLTVNVDAPQQSRRGTALAVPVSVNLEGASVSLEAGELMVVHPTQAKPVSIPLVPSQTDPMLHVAVLPSEFLANLTKLTGYARCKDSHDRTGVSEIFEIPVR